MEALTVKVSSFFRDPLAFEVLAEQVLPELLATKAAAGDPSLRVWSAGCATGEEPYSVAILLHELLRRESSPPSLTVLATDVDSGEAVLFSAGNLRDAVRASCSFPGVFPPMLLDGRRLYDGGVSQVIPVRYAREMAGDGGLVLALDCNSGTRWPGADSFVAVALRAGLTLLRGRTRSELLGADVVIAPAMGESGWMQPRRIPRFYAEGQQACREALPEIRRLLEG